MWSQVADTLQFLHNDCNLVHRAVCPDAIMVVGGFWKLALMGFAVMAEFNTDSGSEHAISYDATDTEATRLLRPPLRYVAPELIAGSRSSGALTTAADTYSFGELLQVFADGCRVLSKLFMLFMVKVALCYIAV